jgi:hypothetical protein
MAEVKKRRRKSASKKRITIKKGMKDYSSDPFFKKKAEAVHALLKKTGLPVPSDIDKSY